MHHEVLLLLHMGLFSMFNKKKGQWVGFFYVIYKKRLNCSEEVCGHKESINAMEISLIHSSDSPTVTQWLPFLKECFLDLRTTI